MGVFDQLFNPSENGPGTIFGAIGRAMGVPNDAERLGAARGQAMNEMADILSNMPPNTPPGQAVLKYLNSPQGVRAFTQDPAFHDTVANFVKNLTPEAPTVLSAGPGSVSSAVDRQGNTRGSVSAPQNVNTPEGSMTTQMFPGGRQGAQVTNPSVHQFGPGVTPGVMNQGQLTMGKTTETAPVQSFKSFQDIATLPRDALEEAARWQMEPPEVRKAESGPIRQMVKRGLISAENGLKMESGLIKIYPDEAWGHKTGDFIQVDSVNNTARVIRPDFGVSAPKPGEEQRSDLPAAQPRPSMLTGAGANAWLTRATGGAVRSVINPAISSQASELDAQRNDYVDQARFAVSGVRAVGGNNSRLKSQADAAMALLPDTGVKGDPLRANQKGLQLHDMIDSEITNAEATSKDRRMPPHMAEEALRAVDAWKRVRESIPTRNEINEQIKLIRSGGGNVPTATRTIGDTLELGRSGVKGAGEALSANRPSKGVQAKQQAEVETVGKMDLQALYKLNPATLTPQGVTARGQRIRELTAGQE